MIVDPAIHKAIDFAVLDPYVPSSENQDASQSGSDSVDIEVSQDHHVSAGGIHDNSVGPRNEDSRESAVPIEDDRLGDGDGAEPTGVQCVDFPVRGGFGNGSSESLARSGAAARVGIVANARDPGPRGLGVRD
jgi:hypothetical protein